MCLECEDGFKVVDDECEEIQIDFCLKEESDECTECEEDKIVFKGECIDVFDF